MLRISLVSCSIFLSLASCVLVVLLVALLVVVLVVAFVFVDVDVFVFAVLGVAFVELILLDDDILAAVAGDAFEICCDA